MDFMSMHTHTHICAYLPTCTYENEYVQTHACAHTHTLKVGDFDYI